MKIVATKTDKYAQEKPSMPILYLEKGKEYDVSDSMGKRIIELDGANEIKIKQPLPEKKPTTKKQEPKSE